MKIQITKATGSDSRVYSHAYTLVDSIGSIDFKELMQVSKYDSAKKTGLVAARNEKAFLALATKIEASNSEDAKVSHAKAAAKKPAAKKISFSDYCEEYLDLNTALMSKEQISEARASFNKI